MISTVWSGWNMEEGCEDFAAKRTMWLGSMCMEEDRGLIGKRMGRVCICSLRAATNEIIVVVTSVFLVESQCWDH